MSVFNDMSQTYIHIFRICRKHLVIRIIIAVCNKILIFLNSLLYLSFIYFEKNLQVLNFMGKMKQETAFRLCIYFFIRFVRVKFLINIRDKIFHEIGNHPQTCT